jgi:hypothetical protein
MATVAQAAVAPVQQGAQDRAPLFLGIVLIVVGLLAAYGLATGNLQAAWAALTGGASSSAATAAGTAGTTVTPAPATASQQYTNSAGQAVGGGFGLSGAPSDTTTTGGGFGTDSASGITSTLIQNGLSGNVAMPQVAQAAAIAYPNTLPPLGGSAPVSTAFSIYGASAA